MQTMSTMPEFDHTSCADDESDGSMVLMRWQTPAQQVRSGEHIES